jgi:hypothetical protein
VSFLLHKDIIEEFAVFVLVGLLLFELVGLDFELFGEIVDFGNQIGFAGIETVDDLIMFRLPFGQLILKGRDIGRVRGSNVNQ